MIDNLTAKKLYRMLYYLRYVEDVIGEEYKTGLMKCPVHFYTGQEAVAAGISLNLTLDDYVTSNHRSHGHYLAKGGSLKKLLAEIYCLPSGCTGGWGGSQHPYAPDVGILGTSAIVSGGIPFATGIGQALQWQGKKNISTVFFGDGATEEGNFYESLNYAAVKSLPVLFVCENNGLAVHSPLGSRRHTRVELTKIAESLGVTAIQIDGNDAACVYNAAQDITAAIRKKQKPYFIEAITYRWKGHVSPEEDYGERYRTPKDISKWKKLCPLELFVTKLLEYHEMNLDDIKQIQHETRVQVDIVVAEVRRELEAMVADTVPVTPY